jgi:hypothetical protein
MKYRLDNNSLLSPFWRIIKIQATITPIAAGAKGGTTIEAPTALAATRRAALIPAVAAHTEPTPAADAVVSILACALFAVAFSEAFPYDNRVFVTSSLLGVLDIGFTAFLVNRDIVLNYM